MISVLMGSSSDYETAIKPAIAVLKESGVSYDVQVLSAHRTPNELLDFVSKSKAQVFIAAAGGAAHLAGVVAAHTTKPVIGIPVKTDMSGGLDSLLSTVMMPGGVSVACVGVNNGKNAAILALQILAIADPKINEFVQAYRRKVRDEALQKNNEFLKSM